MEMFVGESGTAWSYDLSQRIGDPSGMGEVFRGSSPSGEPVAVKRVKLRLDSEGERRRREREVEIAAVLASVPSEYTLPTLDLARVGDDLLIVMPLARRSLAAAVTAGDLDEAARLEVLRQVSLGLVDLAAASVLHRDLKPANVLEIDGRWKLADFGLARNLLEVTGTYTFLGAGTYPYMAPELWASQPATVKSDLYALGVMAYEVLTGSRPFPGPDEAAYRRQHRLEPPPQPAGASTAVARLVLRLMAKDPSDRPQDARAVIEALDAAIKRLTPAQEELRQAALAAEKRRGIGDAKSAALALQGGAAQNQRRQALADLAHILEDAAELAGEALPDLKFRADGAQWHFTCLDVNMTVVPWPGVPKANVPSGDPLIVAGKVQTSTVRVPQANIVCEQHGDRLIWSLLRFSAHALVPNYTLGPRETPHGFEQQVFGNERVYMLIGAMHVWTMQRTALTPGSVVDLLREALNAA